MEKAQLSKTLENYIRRLFKNVSRNGEWINFSCPLAPFEKAHKFNADKSASAGARVATDGHCIWHCYTCKGSGRFTSLLGILEKRLKTSYSDIIQALDDAEELPEYENRFYCAEVKEKATPMEYADIFDNIEDYPIASKYLATRGISPTTANKLGLRYDPDQYRIVFPVRDRKGSVYGWTGRTILPDGKPKIKDYNFPKSQFVLGVEHWNPEYPVLVVEGLFGFAKLHEVTKGRVFPYNIGAIMGSKASSEQLQTLLEFGQPIYCLLDNDDAGKQGMFGKKGLTTELKDHIPTFILRWPKHIVVIDGVEFEREKDDPDDLTYEDICAMLQTPRLVL